MSTFWPFPVETLKAERFPGISPLLLGLHRSLQAGAVPQTLLLVGEPWGGREAVAVELAAMLTCPHGALLCPCGSCRRVREGVHPDIHLLRVAPGHKEIRTEDVEDMLANFLQVPFEAPRQVYVVVNAHTPPLNVFAASALLKTLEEPSSHACWVLLAANPLRVLPTVVSRSVKLKIPSLPSKIAIAETQSRASNLVQTVPASLGAVTEEGDEAEAFLASAQELQQQLLHGDVLALIRLAALAKDRPGRASLLAALALASARQEDAVVAERAVALAEAWVVAQRLHEQMHVGLDTVATATILRALWRT